MGGDPNAFKDILYIKDLCQLLYRGLFAPVNGGTYNAGTGIKTTLKEQIMALLRSFALMVRNQKSYLNQMEKDLRVL